MSTQWQGRTVTTARARWRGRLPLPCWQCGQPVVADQPWVVEHTMPRSLGGHVTDPTNQWVSHRSCSDRSGGKLGGRKGAAVTNARRNAVAANYAEERIRRW